MKLLYIPYSCVFFKDTTGNYAMPAYGNSFWQKYREEFEDVTILGEPSETKKDLVRIDDKIHLFIIPANARPQDFKNDKKVKKALEEHVKAAEAVLIQPTSRKGMMAIKCCEKYKVPYLIEITGDIYTILRNSESCLKRLYAPVLYWQIRFAIKQCKYGLYVTNEYLQKKYPIKGIQCGCTDTNLHYVDEEILGKRVNRINSRIDSDKLIIGLIGTYSNNRKGIDTAIKALSVIEKNNIELHILGFGIEEDRKKWKSYAEKFGVENRLCFDKPLNDITDIFEWIDCIDLCILPSRSEGLPRCIVEACSRACPCIVSDVAGNKELIDERWRHKAGDYKRLSELIIDMFSEKDTIINASYNNLVKSKQYTIDKQYEIRHSFFNYFKEYAEEIINS